MILEDVRGLPTTSFDRKALRRYEQAQDLFLEYRRDPLAVLDEAMALDPEMVMGHCLRAVLYMLSTDAGKEHHVHEALQQAEAHYDAALPREQKHIQATRAWLNGRWEEATLHWEDILLEFPCDILALQAAHLADFFLGHTQRLRDRVARVLPYWDEQTPGYGFVLGMYAFGLEENDDYVRAERMSRQALLINPRDSWAVHAGAHVFEMSGRFRDGLAWYGERLADWQHQDYMACHNWWHLSLFHLELGDVDAVLGIYDDKLRGEKSDVITDLIDASALLWRLMLLEIPVGNRWEEIALLWERAAVDAHYAFNDCHGMMALAMTGRLDLCRKMLDALRKRAAEDDSSNARMTREVGLASCEAVLAFVQGDYAKTIDLLRTMRYRLHRFGGSHAQRDVLHLTLVEAALRQGRGQLARALAAERVARKSASPLNHELEARALALLGDQVGAQAAREHVASLRQS